MSARQVIRGMAAAVGCGMVAALAACSSQPTVTTPDPIPAVSSSTTAEQSAASDTESTLPAYQPSSLVSNAPGSLQMKSSDPVSKVTAFYDEQISKGGWTIISSSKSPASTSITAKKGSTGTTVSISNAGAGSYISLTTYPM